MEHIYSVSQINRYLRGMVQQDPLLSRVQVSGEVSNIKYHSSGHLYFTLKDAGGALGCVMFASRRGGLSFAMKNGDKVVVSGNVDYYERDGKCQLYAFQIRREGIGELYERFDRLRRELAERGMFEAMYKKPLPRYAMRIGIVTAPTGAAIRDIQNIARRRNPHVQLFLYPALVQGDGAKESIVRGIRALDRMGLDVLIVGRGGGSLEDLWAFNEEMVAEAIFDCETPVISAVGHETDTTIADLVADFRAPTPSAAAELAVFDLGKLREDMELAHRQLSRGILQKAAGLRQRARLLGLRIEARSPRRQLRDKSMRAMHLEEAFANAMEEKIRAARRRAELLDGRLRTREKEILTDRQKRLVHLAGRFQGLNPLERLKQGFSFTAGEDGRAVTRISQVQKGKRLTVHVTDGRILTRVEGVEESNF